MKTIDKILQKHLGYGNPTSIQDYINSDNLKNWVFYPHVIAAIAECFGLSNAKEAAAYLSNIHIESTDDDWNDVFNKFKDYKGDLQFSAWLKKNYNIIPK